MKEELVAVVGEVIQALLQRRAPKHEGATVSTDDEVRPTIMHVATIVHRRTALLLPIACSSTRIAWLIV